MMPVYLSGFHRKSWAPVWGERWESLSSGGRGDIKPGNQCAYIQHTLILPMGEKRKQRDTYFRMYFSHSQHRARCCWNASHRTEGPLKRQKHFIN